MDQNDQPIDIAVETSQETPTEIVPVIPPQIVIPRRIKRKKFIRTITLRERNGAGFRETQIPATLRDARLQQVIMVAKLQKTQENALDEILDTNKILTHAEMQGLNNAVKQSSELMTKIFTGDTPAGAVEHNGNSSTFGAALGAGISAGLSVIASGDPDFAAALIAVTKSAKTSRKPETINVTPSK